MNGRSRPSARPTASRRSVPATVSERIRTYNFPQNRLTDHRINFTAYNLDQVIQGDMNALVTALLEADRAAKLGNFDLVDEPSA